ncbi:MAG: hypothetical protein IJA48_00380 [Oscillospiraceae bacterium]|nr:hypothetical protein [Oscillospiraceae bacterium]
MSEYEKSYRILFSGIMDALEQLQRQNYGLAADILIRAQQEAEEAFLNWAEAPADKTIGGSR